MACVKWSRSVAAAAGLVMMTGWLAAGPAAAAERYVVGEFFSLST